MGSNFVSKIWMSIAEGEGMYFSFVCVFSSWGLWILGYWVIFTI